MGYVRGVLKKDKKYITRDLSKARDDLLEFLIVIAKKRVRPMTGRKSGMGVLYFSGADRAAERKDLHMDCVVRDRDGLQFDVEIQQDTEGASPKRT